MRIAFAVCLIITVVGCTGDFGVERAALKGGNSCQIDKEKFERGQLNPANPCQICDPERDNKSWSDVADGTSCNDGNACTRVDACQAGACVGSAPIVCTPLDECHFAGTCDPQTGVCSNPPRSDCGGVPPTSAVIGPVGGTLTTTNGTSIEIPPGAVASDTVISVVESTAPPPSGIGAVTPVLDFGPDGIVFAHPVKITIPLATTAGKLSVWWTKHDGSGTFEPIGGTVVGSSMVVEVTHFSSGVVAADPGFRTISGVEKQAWISSTSYAALPFDLSAVEVEALVSDGAGGYSSIPGSGAADGSFSISNVPDGPALVHVGGRYTVVSNATWVDLSTARIGRPDQVATSNGSSLTFDVGGMTAWQNGDQLELFCTQVDTWYFDIEQYGVPGEPAPGDKSLVGLELGYSGPDSNGQPAHLIQGSPPHSDRCTLAHLQARQSTEQVTYQAMIETFDPPAFDEADGQSYAIAPGSFVVNDTPSVVSIDVEPAGFIQYAVPLAEGAMLAESFTAFGIGGIPTDPTHTLIPSGATADFLLLDLSRGNHTVASGMTYGQPLSGYWYSSGGVLSRSVVQHTLPDAPGRSVFYPQSVATSFQVPGTQGPAIAIAVRLSPPAAPHINGLDLMKTQSGFGATPTVSWSAPLVGAPDFYTIGITHLVNINGGTFKQSVASLATADTSLTLPPGMLTPGERYVFNLAAIHNVPPLPGAELEGTAVPFTAAPTGDFANEISAIVTP